MEDTENTVSTGAEVRYTPDPVVVAWGELDVATVPVLESALDSVLNLHGGRAVEVDLSGVSFIDSSGLGVLVTGLKRAQEHGGTLIVRGLQPSPRKVFEITGLLELFQTD